GPPPVSPWSRWLLTGVPAATVPETSWLRRLYCVPDVSRLTVRPLANRTFCDSVKARMSDLLVNAPGFTEGGAETSCTAPDVPERIAPAGVVAAARTTRASAANRAFRPTTPPFPSVACAL